MGSGHGIRVFLSYAHSDEQWARKLSKHLEAAGFQVVNPAQVSGDNFALEIGRALDRSEAMIVLISPAYVSSYWAQRELQYALGSERFQGRLIPVLIEPTEDFPWVLNHFPWIKPEGNLAAAGRRVSEILQAAGEPDVHADAH